MIEFITGEKGKGKTKILIRKANESVLLSSGSIAFLDKNNKHMYELSNRIRMINVPEFRIENFDMFCGFLYGIASQDHDLEQLYLDSFLTIAHVDPSRLEDAFTFLQVFSETQKIDIVVSISMNADSLPISMQEFVTTSL